MAEEKRKKAKADVWRPVFLETLREHGLVIRAAKEAGINRRTAYAARERSKEFAADWDEALEEARENLEAHVVEFIYSGSEKIHIDTAKWALSRLWPDRYGDKKEVSIAVGEKFEIELKDFSLGGEEDE